MAILALDLGTRTGWAPAEHGRVESGVQVFDVRRGESPGMRPVTDEHRESGGRRLYSGGSALPACSASDWRGPIKTGWR
jgi:hypothetical protein